MITGACCSSLISAICGLPSRPLRCAAHQRSASTSNSGVSSIDKATQATSSDDVCASMTRAPRAAWKTTKPNSPPCASRMTNTARSASGTGCVRAMPHSTSAFTARKPSTSAAASMGCASTAAKSMLMPTAMKKRPSSKPLKGSISVSSSRRYSLSASSTPARNAPSAIDKPTLCISAAVATTSSNAAAVKISGVLLRAIQRSVGRNNKRPPKTMMPMTPKARAASPQPPPASCAALGESASSGTMARMGMAAMSCSSETLSTLWPALVAIRLRSRSTPRPMAVDDMAKPIAATTASRQGTPNAMATPTINAAEPKSCKLPQPKMGRRKDHKRRGSSSRPTRKSINTTPNSANSNMAAGSVTSARPQGPMAMPAPR